MMMRYLLLTLFALCCSFAIPKDCCASCVYENSCKDNSISFRSAYFYPTGKLERKIYNSPIFDIELEGFYSLSHKWGLYLNVAYLEKNGRSDGLNLKTKMRMAPINFGIEYIYGLTDKVSFYVGVGPSLNFISLHDNNPIGKKHTKKCCVGASTKSGFYYDLSNNFFADLFVDYLYIPAGFKNTSNVGGLRAGIGFGLKL
ncbi:MAG: outer membrane beta-barrel protein [Verrucomicrobia bacterium]|nr:outer membrane beta-barrel protein [Verrucomicrobiota bacterium]